MRVRSFLALAVVTIVAAVVAAILVAREERPAGVAGVGDPLLPNLLADANRIAEIRISGDGKTVTLGRRDDPAAAAGGGWVITDRGNFPASFEAVKGLVVGLAGLRKLEPKTNRPAEFARIGVADPGPGAPSTEVALADRDGQPLARVILGKEVFAAGGDGRYVRVPGAPQAWLVSGRIDAAPAVRGWTEPVILDVPSAELRTITVRRPGTAVIEAVRPDPAAAGFTLRNLPAGRQQRQDGSADSLGDVFARLELEDVQPAASLALPANSTVRVRIETFDGLIVDVAVAERDGATWMTVVPTTTRDAAPEVRARAAEIAERTAGWAYEVGAWRLAPLLKPLEDWLAPRITP